MASVVVRAVALTAIAMTIWATEEAMAHEVATVCVMTRIGMRMR